MAGNLHYLPGTRAYLVYQDEGGTSHFSIIQVVDRRIVRGHFLYEVKAPEMVLSRVQLIAPFVSDTVLEHGWTVGLVREESLRPLGSRSFQIVQ